MSGEVYQYDRGGRYAFVGEARHTHSLQTCVVFFGLDGDDAGKMLITTQYEWGERFKLTGEETLVQLVDAMKGKVAGQHTPGTQPW